MTEIAIRPLLFPLMPRRIVESSWMDHGPFAHWLVKAFRPSLVVELGCHHGYSLCCFSEQMQRSRVPGQVIGIDTWQGDEHAGYYGNDVYEQLNAYVSAQYPDLTKLKRQYFSEALPSIEDKSVDLLHVDGRHYYDDVVEDFTSWVPKLSDRAVVLFHDTQERGRDFGVYRYWGELEKQYPTFEFLHGHGLGVVRIGKDATPSLERLFSAAKDPAARTKIRSSFERRGAFIRQWRKLQPKTLGQRIMTKVRRRVKNALR